MCRLKSIWRLLNLPCREMTRLASESLDRDLDRWERIALKSHLLYCRGCRRFSRQIVLLRRALRQVMGHIETEHVLPETGMPAEVRARIKRALTQSERG